MCQELGLDRQTGAFSLSDGLVQADGIPVNDDGRQQIESSHPVVLAFAGTVANFALASDAQGVFQGVMGLAFVQPDMGASAHARVEHPIDDEECALDAADFAKRRGEIMLARIGSELAQQLARRDGPRHHGGGASQHVGPVRRDQFVAHLAADQYAQLIRNGAGVKDMEALGWQVPNPRDELVSEERRNGEDMVGEAARCRYTARVRGARRRS